MISAEEALNLILENVFPLGREIVSLNEAHNRVLAEPAAAQSDVPPFNRSPFDGYAFRAEDTGCASAEEGVYLKVEGEIKEGTPFQPVLQRGACFRVCTGAPLPKNADAVAPQETVLRRGSHIFLMAPFAPGTNVAAAGEDIRRGETVLEKDTLLEPVHLGILASLGLTSVMVYRRPVVGIFSTGMELKMPGEKLPFGHIYDSNGSMMVSLAQRFGAESVFFGIVKDDTNALALHLLEALKRADIVVTTGGVSVGDCDLIGEALKKIGAKFLFWRVDMKPGTPTLAALKNGKLLLCLPGNPAAAFVSFDQLVRPALLKMGGHKDWLRPVIWASLENKIPAARGQNRFIRALCTLHDGVFHVRALWPEQSGVLSSYRNANAYILHPAGSPSLIPGDKVAVQLISLPKSTSAISLFRSLPHQKENQIAACPGERQRLKNNSRRHRERSPVAGQKAAPSL